METTQKMNAKLEMRSQLLGVYHQSAAGKKLAQQSLMSSSAVWLEIGTPEDLAEAELVKITENAQSALQSFDKIWWKIRQELDEYLSAAKEHTSSTKRAVDVLQDYASRCRSSFKEVKHSYKLSAQAKKHAHRALQHAWISVSTQLGMLASEIADGSLVGKLAMYDLEVLWRNPKLQGLKGNTSLHVAFCANASAAFDQMENALTIGLAGQTRQQISALFWEMEMLRSPRDIT